MNDSLAPMFRMPVSFGPAPGPRNLPDNRRDDRYRKQITSLSLSARADPALLSRLLPSGFVLEGEPRLHVTLSMFRDIGWLAGRGYNIVLIAIPARWEGEEQASGQFVPVVWENMADPIITGREELGWSKVYAEISDLEERQGLWSAQATWDGFRFLDLSAQDFEPAEPVAPAPMMFAKYMPRTGAWGVADVNHATITAPDGPPSTLHVSEAGQGRFAFHAARWEDMPTQYPIVNALAALPLDDFGPARLVRASGGGDGSGQRILL